MSVSAQMMVASCCALVLAGCAGQGSDEPRAGAEASAPEASRSTPSRPEQAAPSSDRASSGTGTTAPSTPRSDRPRIVVLGDSLTAGLGLDLKDSFPARLQAQLEKQGYRYAVINAGVSGDTSAGGLRRLDWAMADGVPRVLIVALGGNDGLRGLPPEQLESNLAAIIERAESRGVAVVLAGMEAPPNFGADYTARFRAVYPTLARRFEVPLVPFLLQGVAGDPALNQADGIHPNARGAEAVAALVWGTLQPTLDTLQRHTSR